MTTLPSLIATAADSCMKPWLHAVVMSNDDSEITDIKDEYIDQLFETELVDVVVRIECRDSQGDRHPEKDLELEVFRSGSDLNLVLGWCNRPDSPLLWQGRHAVWMDPNTGKRCSSPHSGLELESFARRLRALFCLPG